MHQKLKPLILDLHRQILYTAEQIKKIEDNKQWMV